ncbi:MAG: alkaline phosphatase [Woeseia sp.]
MDIDPPCRYIAAMTKTTNALASFFAAATLITACGTPPSNQPAVGNDDLPRGIILIVGDGMGSAHFTLARLLRGDDYHIGRLPHTALIGTASADSRATDSAAAATAYATGVKTNNDYVGVDSAGIPQTTVVEIAQQRGLATGLVTTAPFGDATPAAFAAHTRNRRDIATVAEQIVTSGVDVVASTGLEYFGVEGIPTLEQFARRGGYQAVSTAAELKAAETGPVLAVLPSGTLDSDSPEMPLAELAAWTMKRLAEDPDGFFLLIEHEGTDSASHANDMAALRTSLRSLDETVGTAMDFAEERGDVLLIVLSDHGTGGFQLAGKLGAQEDRFTSRDHTGEDVPLFAAGPGAEAFNGFMDNTEVGQLLLSLVRRPGG